jgi:putative thioredoxin
MLGETGAALAGASDLIKDGTDASFMADVIEESRRQPVIVDFWATWCGPCKQLGPALEKAVAAAKGAVKLVKVDVDKNPRIAGQLRVQSIPTVYAFVDGQPVDGFMGAVPDSQLKAFIDRLAAADGAGAAPGAEDLEALLQMGAESLQLNDLGGAAQAFAQALQLDPENLKAIAGLGRVYLAGGEADRAREILEMAPKDAKSPELDSLRAALTLAAAVPSDVAQYEHRLALDENDHEARLELAKALAGRHQLDEAVDQLLRIVEKDRDWNDGAARAQLLQIFEAAGPGSETARRGRRRLSAILFS